jgi:hypothetical protein
MALDGPVTIFQMQQTTKNMWVQSWLGIPIFGSDSGTPIVSRILFPFLIPEILVGRFFLNSAVETLTNWNSDSKIWNSKKKIIPRNTVILISYQKTISKRLPPSLHLLKTVAAISTSTQNGCHHLYISSKRLPPSLHLLKTVAAISTSTQDGCPHLYIYSKRVDVIMAGQKNKRQERFLIHEIGESMVGEDSELVGMCYELA